jgi:hypothetical protein
MVDKVNLGESVSFGDTPVVNSVIVGLNKPGTRSPTLKEGSKYMRNKETGVIYPWQEVGAKRDNMEEFVYRGNGKEAVIKKPENLNKKVSFANSGQHTGPQRMAAGAMGDLSVPTS